MNKLITLSKSKEKTSLIILVLICFCFSCSKLEVITFPPHDVNCLGQSFVGEWSGQDIRNRYDSLGIFQSNTIENPNFIFYSSGVLEVELPWKIEYKQWISECAPDQLTIVLPNHSSDSLFTESLFNNQHIYELLVNSDTLKEMIFQDTNALGNIKFEIKRTIWKN